MRTLLAGITFVLLYGVAIRLYLLLRARRDAGRWHAPAVLLAGALGGLAFYLTVQIKAPYAPRLLDIPAFLIMAAAAAAIPVILELATVVRARAQKSSTLETPAGDVRRREPGSE
jgi:hypothetical protein